jgi:hypothetical protein
MGMGTMSLFFSFRKQLQEVRANQSNYEEKIESLSSIQNADALKINREFLETTTCHKMMERMVFFMYRKISDELSLFYLFQML